jgi:hypothetical protein
MNTEIHHQAYFGRQMPLQERMEKIRDVFHLSLVQQSYKDKVKVEKIKSILTDSEHVLGEFHPLSENIFIEKEVTIVKDERTQESYIFPTTMIICALDNIQSRFHLVVNVAIKERLKNIPGLLDHYNDLVLRATYLRSKYHANNTFFDLMKDWDARIIGMTVEDQVDDLGFDSLTEEIESGWREKFHQSDLRLWNSLIQCRRYETNKELQVHLAFYFTNLSKSFGHPILNPVDGIKQLRENSNTHPLEHIPVDDQLVINILAN